MESAKAQFLRKIYLVVNLALKYHPDKNKDPGAEEKFNQIGNDYYGT